MTKRNKGEIFIIFSTILCFVILLLAACSPGGEQKKEKQPGCFSSESDFSVHTVPSSSESRAGAAENRTREKQKTNGSSQAGNPSSATEKEGAVSPEASFSGSETEKEILEPYSSSAYNETLDGEEVEE